MNRSEFDTNFSLPNDAQLIQLERVRDFFYAYVYPVLGTYGVIANTINISVFLHPLLRDPIYTYLLFSSIGDCVYSLLVIGFRFPNCGIFCSIEVSHSYLSTLYLIYFDDFFSSSLAIFNVMIELAVSLQRFLVVYNTRACARLQAISPLKLLPILFLISLLYYLPELIFQEIVLDTRFNETAIYTKVLTNFAARTNVLKILEIVMQAIRGPVCLIILVIINALTIIRFKGQMKNKIRLKAKNTASFSATKPRLTRVDTFEEVSTPVTSHHTRTVEINAIRNLNYMVFAIIIIYLLGTIPYTLRIILGVIFDIDRIWPKSYIVFQVISLTCLYLVHSSNIFAYYKFNKNFRSILKKYARCVFRQNSSISPLDLSKNNTIKRDADLTLTV